MLVPWPRGVDNIRGEKKERGLFHDAKHRHPQARKFLETLEEQGIRWVVCRQLRRRDLRRKGKDLEEYYYYDGTVSGLSSRGIDLLIIPRDENAAVLEVPGDSYGLREKFRRPHLKVGQTVGAFITSDDMPLHFSEIAYIAIRKYNDFGDSSITLLKPDYERLGKWIYDSRQKWVSSLC